MSRHLLVIGAQRCGTTYLHDLLAAHPQVAMARPSRPEPKVFLSEELAGRGPEWYRRTYFAHATDETVLGEKSTSYLEYAEAARRAAEALGDPLIVAVLRDPVARAVSHWAFSSENGLESRPLADALLADLAGPQEWDRSQVSVSPFAYLQRGHYARYLVPWRDRFGADLHVVFFDELVADPAVLAGLYDALGVDAGFRPDFVGNPVNASNHPRPELSAELRTRLREHFADSDRELAELLGRELPWRAPDQPAEGTTA